jgi:hypothetical protein
MRATYQEQYKTGFLTKYGYKEQTGRLGLQKDISFLQSQPSIA